jgi:hypothetical protein
LIPGTRYNTLDCPGGNGWTGKGCPHTHNGAFAGGEFPIWVNPTAGLDGRPSSLYHNFDADLRPQDCSLGSELFHAGLTGNAELGVRQSGFQGRILIH